MFDTAAEVIKTILPHAYNGYVNNSLQFAVPGLPLKSDGAMNGYWRYSENQMALIGEMLKGINAVPVESIVEFLNGVEEEIVAGKLTYEEQIPLLVAVQIGKSDWEYWQAQIATPGAWTPYLNTDNAINYMHVAGWVNAAMKGALLAYGLIKPPQVQFIDLYSSAISSTGLVAGKVMWGWWGR